MYVAVFLKITAMLLTKKLRQRSKDKQVQAVPQT